MFVLKNSDVAQALSIDDAIVAVRDAFLALGRGDVVMPQRLAMPVMEATHLSMPCYVGGGSPILTHKTVTYFPQNAARGLPTLHSTVTVLDPGTGEPLAVMDGELLTAMRTGAVSGIATQLLSRESSRTLGVVGTGEVAYWQIAAVCAVRPIERVVIGARDPEKARGFADRVTKQLGVACEFEPDTRAIATISDVACLATTSAEPVLFGRDVRAGTHINGVGSFRRDMREVDVELVKKSKVVVDLVTAAQHGAGELIAAAEEGVFDWGESVELSQLVREPGFLRADEDVTYFKSVGLAVQDAVCARLVYDRSR